MRPARARYVQGKMNKLEEKYAETLKLRKLAGGIQDWKYAVGEVLNDPKAGIRRAVEQRPAAERMVWDVPLPEAPPEALATR